MNDQYAIDALEEKPKSRHFSKKDAVWAVVFIVLGALFVVPTYVRLMADRNKHMCKNNLGDISQAMLVYATQNNDRFPPAYAMEETTYAPWTSPKGVVSTWVSQLAPFMNHPKTSFLCPSADKVELVENEGLAGETIMSSYGMFGGLSGVALGDVADPSGVAMIAETSNMGSKGSYDPLPMVGEGGKTKPDGFLIGFDNCNYIGDATLSDLGKARFATRLAFDETSKGDFTVDKIGRHGTTIHFVFQDRHIESLPSTLANIQRFDGKKGEIVKLWALP